MKPFGPDMLLCNDMGMLSEEDTDPRLRELSDDGRDRFVGVGGSGFSNSFLNSVNNLSRPGCI